MLGEVVLCPRNSVSPEFVELIHELFNRVCADIPATKPSDVC